MPETIEDRLLAAVAFHNAFDLVAAQSAYREILEIDPLEPDALHLLGVTFSQQGLPESAIPLIQKSININPKNVLAHSNLGNAFQMTGQFKQAIGCYESGLVIDPNNADTLFNRGVALLSDERKAEALSSFQSAATHRPSFASAHFQCGKLHYFFGQMVDAVVSFDHVILEEKSHKEAHFIRGNALHGLGKNLDAIVSYDLAIALDVEYAEAYYNRGISLQLIHQNDDALDSYRQAIRIRPFYPEALNNQGNTLQSLGLYKEALNSYATAQEIFPEYADAHWNEALCHLKTGDFEKGWEKYEWRWDNAISNPYSRVFDEPLWHGSESLVGKTIRLHSEQGFGDTIQFCRYAEMVAQRGGIITLDVQPSLVALMENVAGVQQVISQGDGLEGGLAPFDFHCPLLSLPLAFGTRMSSIPSAQAYLQSEDALDEGWLQFLGLKNKPRIGLVWTGSKFNQNDHARSLPLLELVRILRSDVDWFSLQNETPQEHLPLLEQYGVRHFDQALNSFSDTAALISQMDLVISVDTSVAHLAAALGKPTWVLLAHSSDFRWLLGRNDSPWYPSMRLFRQTDQGNWAGVLDRILAKTERYFDLSSTKFAH